MTQEHEYRKAFEAWLEDMKAERKAARRKMTAEELMVREANRVGFNRSAYECGLKVSKAIDNIYQKRGEE